ncbi:T9SS type A sorting domain-containing protein [candidate division KSB1 bacterium]|nr:T9SS type A sorting domain-containing protein [candidate division KSB1 bacterium]
MKKQNWLFIALLISFLTSVLTAQSFQDAGFRLPYTMSALNSRTAYIPAKNCIYIFGGYANNVWSNRVVKIDLNSASSYEITEVMPVGGDVAKVGYNSDDGLVYLFAGKDVYYFNPATEKFTKKATGILQETVHDYVTLTYGSTEKAFYIFGNRGSARGNFTLKYIPSTNSSTNLTNTLQPSNNTSPAASYCQNRNLVYLFGGNQSSYEYDIIQKFNPTNSTFTTLTAKLFQTTGGPTSVYVPAENSVYVIGGHSSGTVLKRTSKFDCSAESIAAGPDLPETRHAIGAEYAGNENRIYVFGGTISGAGGYAPASDRIHYLQLAGVTDAPFSPDAHTVALYHFDEGSGTIIKDATTNGNNGTSYGPQYTTGRFSYGLKFDGYNDYCKVPSSSSFSTTNSNKQLTIDVWIKINQYPSGSKEGGLLSKWGAGGIEDDEWLLNLMSNGTIRFVINSSTSSVGPFTELKTNTISIGVFHLISAVWNGVTKEAAIYVDGVQVAYTNSAVGNMPVTSEPIDIGSDWVWTTDGAYNGIIDEIRISNIDRYINSAPTPTITVISPNGGETWYNGDSKTISWSSQNHSGNVKIELYNGSSYYATIVSSTADDGSHAWTIPSNHAESNQYRVKISSVSDATVYDYSDNYFTIKPKANPTITVISPNGGEIWEIGSAQQIRWSSANHSANVKIELYKGLSLHQTISSSTTDDGLHTWTIPSLEENTNYRIKITSTANSAVYDFSDNYFTIRKPAEIPPITPVATSPQYPNSEFWLDINVGSAAKTVSNLKIVSFELSYTNTAIIDYSSYENGTFLTGSTATVIADDPGGMVSASVYKTSGGNSGYGTVLRLKFKILSTAQNNQSITFSFKQVQANDANGQVITLSPANLTITVQSGLLVWPGDADNNGRVAIFDINPIIAAYWNKTGPARKDASVEWRGQWCEPWSPPEATYADCNGDGKVSIFDINPVVINFTKTHTLQQQQNGEPGNALAKSNLAGADVYLVIRDYDDVTKEFWIDIIAGSAQEKLDDLKVISFELAYTNTNQVDYESYSNGTFPSSAQATVIVDEQAGLISASVYRSDAGETGWGRVLSFIFKAEKNVSFEMQFRAILANNSSGNIIPLEPRDQSIRTSIAFAAMPTQFELRQNYPNPFNPSTTIKYAIPVSSDVRVEIFNTMGHLVKTVVSANQPAGYYSILWDATNDDGSAVASGVYYYAIRAGDFNQVRKMLYMK